MEIAPGAVHLSRYLDLAAQTALASQVRALMDGAVPAYVPVVRGGGTMHVRMLCLGRHWNGKTYSYEATRSDFDNLPVPPLPGNLKALAGRIAQAAGMTLDADLAIVNYYDADGRMGLHQDKDESEASLAAGLPVVSISLGDSCLFRIGGRKRGEPTRSIRLSSGVVLVLAFHGVGRIFPGTSSLLPDGVRINLTLRRVTRGGADLRTDQMPSA